MKIVYQNLVLFKSKNSTNLKPCLIFFSSIFQPSFSVSVEPGRLCKGKVKYSVVSRQIRTLGIFFKGLEKTNRFISISVLYSA